MLPIPKFALMLTALVLPAVANAQPSSVFPPGSLPYTVAGKGTPAVVFDSGLGNARLSWTPIFPTIALDTQVFAFDRPGYKASPEVVNPADIADDGQSTLSEQANHLHALLQQAGVAPPYVLVGHSLGAETLLAFTKLYHDEVAGLVFVDGRLPSFTAACKAAGIQACAPTREMLAGAPDYIIAEMEGAFATETTETATLAELGDIPITLIVATEPPKGANPEMQQTQDVWRAEQLRYAEAAADARHIEATGSQHYIHRERPELVINEIRIMLARVKTGQWPAPAARP